MRSFKMCISFYTNCLKQDGLKKKTRRAYIRDAVLFLEYINFKHNITDIREVLRDHIEEYINILNKYEKPSGERYGQHTKAVKLHAVTLMFKYLYTCEKLLVNPALEMRIKDKRDNVTEIFTVAEMIRVLDSIEIDSKLGLRDRAIYELLYSTGLRISEVVKLKHADIDLKNRYVAVRVGKFDKDRIVPINQTASRFMTAYGGSKKSEYFFNLSAGTVNYRFRQYLKKLGLHKQGRAVHAIRHTCATHLLENGANVRYVQELLGHEDIETTVKYTHTLTANQKKMHRKYHPKENEYYEEAEENYILKISKYYKRLRLAKAASKYNREVRKRLKE